MAIDRDTKRVLCVDHDVGRRHDVKLLRQAKVRPHPDIRVVVDSGFQGWQRVHAKTDMPKKRTKIIPLTQAEKARNWEIASERTPCENVIAVLKRFKIIADRYRNRRRRFGLRFFLIAAIYNAELDMV